MDIWIEIFSSLQDLTIYPSIIVLFSCFFQHYCLLNVQGKHAVFRKSCSIFIFQFNRFCITDVFL